MFRIIRISTATFCLADVGAMVAAAAALQVEALATVGIIASWLVAAIAFDLCGRNWWVRPAALASSAAKTWCASSLVGALIVVRSPPSAVPLSVLVVPAAGVIAGVMLRLGWRWLAMRRRKRVVIADAVGEPRLSRWVNYYWPEWEVARVLGARDLDAAGPVAAGEGAQVAYYLNGAAPPAVPRGTALLLDDLLEHASGRVPIDHRSQGECHWSVPRAAVKRAMDVTVAAAGLTLLSPLLAALAALIKLESRGPAIYRQQRLGIDCQPFEMLKFRSMVDQAEAETGAVWARPDDPRCTRLGRILRPLHLDELPQLVNVLRGEMSLIGPRPERPELCEELMRTVAAYRQRLSVRPGISGWAQVNQGYDREMDDVRHKLEYDLYYVKRGGPLFDVAVMLRTIDAVIFGKPRRPAQHDLP
jgi:lipopolysaccharide/colanic/teichoic acid biosynthesis glycosyltransferase